MMEPGRKIGVLVGFIIIGVASWVHSLSKSATLQGWFPGVFEKLQDIVAVAPFLIFFGFYVIFYSLIRRPFVSLILTVPIALVLAMLLWA